MGLLDGAVVLCGAGISVRPPSVLPSGSELTRLLVELVARGSCVYTHADMQAVLTAIDDSLGIERSLRLELVFELLSREIDLTTLVEVFSLLKQAVPNAFHYALVLSDAATIFTTNQDVLLEQAAHDLRHPHETVHLHGRCDQPSSIITTIGQYAAGLPGPSVDSLNDALVGKRLVVLGYSGRDRDIMPVLATSAATEIVWIQYAPASHTVGLSPELQALSSFLKTRLTIVREPDPYGWLGRQVGGSRTRLAEAAVRATSSAPIPYPVVGAKFDAIEERNRELALCRLLRHTGAKEIALKGLRRLRRRKAGDHPNVSLAIAGLMNDLGNRRAAAVRYARVAAQYRATPNVACRALLGRCEALANEMDYAGAGAAITDLRRIAARLPLVRRRHFQGWAAERSARMKSMSGDDSGALREYATALRYFEELHDIDGLTVARTFMSDVLRSRGRYRDAVALLEKVLDDSSLYARTSYKPWPWFYHGTTIAAMGNADAGISELQRAQLFALTEHNWQAAAWAAVVRACFERSRDLSAAQAALGEAEALTTSRSGTTLAHFRTLFEHAEMARARAEFTAVGKQVDYMRGWLASKAINAPYMWAHVAAIEAEAARDSGDPQAAALLSEVARQFGEIRAIACVARIRTSLWLVRGGAPPGRLVELCRREGYGFELARLTASPARNDYYPLHVL